MFKHEVKLVINGDDWEQIIDNKTNRILAEGPHLAAEDVLYGLGYHFDVEYIGDSYDDETT